MHIVRKFMRIASVALALFLGIGLISCTTDNGQSGEGPGARQAGKDAYHAAQAAKRDLKKAEQEIRKAGKSFREGWNEAKNGDKIRRDK
jgi:hypothetical protein